MSELQQRTKEELYVDFARERSPVFVCQLLSRYAVDLSETLNGLTEMKAEEWMGMKCLAINLCHQMNGIKKEIVALKTDIEMGTPSYFEHFFLHMQDIRERLHRLKPSEVRKAKLRIHVSKYMYHKKELKSLRKRLWKDLTKHLFKAKFKKILADLRQDVELHQVGMKQAAVEIEKHSKK